MFKTNYPKHFATLCKSIRSLLSMCTFSLGDDDVRGAHAESKTPTAVVRKRKFSNESDDFEVTRDVRRLQLVSTAAGLAGRD